MYKRQPQHRFDPSQQLARTKRLDQIVIGPQFQTEHPIQLLITTRYKDDREPTLTANTTTDF